MSLRPSTALRYTRAHLRLTCECISSAVPRPLSQPLHRSLPCHHVRPRALRPGARLTTTAPTPSTALAAFAIRARIPSTVLRRPVPTPLPPPEQAAKGKRVPFLGTRRLRANSPSQATADELAGWSAVVGRGGVSQQRQRVGVCVGSSSAFGPGTGYGGSAALLSLVDHRARSSHCFLPYARPSPLLRPFLPLSAVGGVGIYTTHLKYRRHTVQRLHCTLLCTQHAHVATADSAVAAIRIRESNPTDEECNFFTHSDFSDHGLVRPARYPPDLPFPKFALSTHKFAFLFWLWMTSSAL
ncbi:hypothetical protein B0H19DRAFT_1386636 [Mycena capillaripes]|nr:hypothetical protein B0H19DRAFT_1386636 [Mycena capillaripes]